MATKRPRSKVAPTDRPLQLTDIDAPGRKALGGIMGDWGKQKTKFAEHKATVSAAHSAASERLGASSSAKETAVAGRSIKKQEHAGARLALVEPHLKNTSVTISRAAEARVSLARGGATRMKSEGSSSPLRESGAGWYFEHRKALNAVAEKHDLPQENVVAASAQMSPMNSPENERTAVAALAHLHKENPTLTFDTKSRTALGLKGKSVKYSDLTPSQASFIGSPQYRSGIKGTSQDVLRGVATGGPNKNVAKAIGTLRGEAQSIDPHTSAKVWGYHEATKNAQPGTAVHEEYLTRAQTALHEMPGQQTIDLFGLRHSTEGILNPKGHTAEDTWMNAVSSGQPLQGIEHGRHIISPAKVVGSEKSIVTGSKSHGGVTVHPSPSVTGEGVRHAWNNAATIEASSRLSRGTDVQVPSVLSQETSWTEARRVAGKDPEYNVARTGTIKPGRKTVRPANRGQGRIF